MKALEHVKPYLRTYRRPYLLGALAMVISGVFLIAKPRFAQVAIDSLRMGEESSIDLSFLAICCAGIVLAMVGRCGFFYLTRRLMIVASRRIENDIRNDLFHNEAKRAAESNLVDMMGRAAVHSGQIITWDDVVKSDFQFCQDIDQMNYDTPPPLQPDSEGRYPVPVPGVWTEI